MVANNSDTAAPDDAPGSGRRRVAALLRLPSGHSLLRNSAYIMLTTGINSLLGYAFWVAVARIYEPEEIGVAAALIAAMMLLATIADLGTSRSLVQRLPLHRDDDHEWSRILTASVIVTVTAGLIMGVISAWAILPGLSGQLEPVGDSAGYVLLFAAGVAAWSLTQISDYVFIAERRAGNMTTRNFSFGVLKIPLVLLAALALSGGPFDIFGSWVAAAALSVAFAYLVLLPRLTPRFAPVIRGAAATVRAMVRPYVGNYLITVGSTLAQFLLPVIVIAKLGASDNAYFYIAWLLGSAFFTISSSVATALFAEGVHDPAQRGAQVRSAAKIIAALLAPMIVLFLAGGDLMLGVFGSEYADAGTTLLLLLTASAIPDAVTNIYIAYLRAQERFGVPVFLSLLIAAETLIIAWALLPSMGITAVGVGWLAAQVSGSVFVGVHLWLSRRGASAHGRARPGSPEAPAADD